MHKQQCTGSGSNSHTHRHSMALPPDASAAAAVAGLFLAATFASPLNFKLTGSGFHLYIPLGISTACE